jgi:hypothetical protein
MKKYKIDEIAADCHPEPTLVFSRSLRYQEATILFFDRGLVGPSGQFIVVG